MKLFANKPTLLVATGIVLTRLATLPAYPILDKSEARYSYISELMVQTGNWVTPFIDHDVPFWAKPVLSTWLTATSFVLFGINEFAARLPAFLIFCVVAWLISYLIRRRGDLGIVASCIFCSTALGFFLGGTVMTDPALMLGITLSMVSFWFCLGRPVHADHRKTSHLWGYLFFVGVAVGVLAKGPIGGVIPGLALGVWVAKERCWVDLWRRMPWVSGTVLMLVLIVPWYALAEYRTPGFLKYFLLGEHLERFLVPHWTGDLYGAGRQHMRGTIWLFGFIMALPWSLLPIVLFFKSDSKRQWLTSGAWVKDAWLSYLLLWMLAPLILFTLSANTLPSYVAPALPPFALLMAELLRGTGENLDAKRLAAAAAIVPMTFVVAVVAVHVSPKTSYLRSEAYIVATFHRLAANQPSELIYLVDRPYSADYYSGGKAKVVQSVDELERQLRDADEYVVVASDVYPKLPKALKNRLRVIVDRNHYVLLRAKGDSEQSLIMPHD